MKLSNKTLAFLITITMPIWIAPYVVITGSRDLYKEILEHLERRKWQ